MRRPAAEGTAGRPSRARSFSDEVRTELCRTLPAEASARRALLSAIVRTAGAFHLHGRGQVHVEVDLGLTVAARRTVELLRALGGSCEIRSYRAPRFGGAPRIVIVAGGDAATLRVLRDAGLLGPSLAPAETPPARLVAGAAARAAYLRGAFIAAGSVSAPRRPAHLELRAHDLAGAELLRRLAAADGIALAVRDRGDHAAAYSKRLEPIADLLARIGAGDAALRLAEAEVVARVREGANRRANAETANLRRQVDAARRQLDAIDRLEEGGVLDGLSGAIQGAALLRRAHPEATLGELAARAVPPLSKPTLAGRLRRLVELAEEEGAGGPPSPGRA